MTENKYKCIHKLNLGNEQAKTVAKVRYIQHDERKIELKIPSNQHQQTNKDLTPMIKFGLSNPKN